MLRLKPTEIVLTLAEIDETRQRIERRKATQPMNYPPRIRVPLIFPTGARIRRGAHRSRDAAVVTLGIIPNLQPQEVVRASVDEDFEPCPESPEAQRELADHELPTLPFPHASSSFGSFQLPLRPASRIAANEEISLESQLHRSNLDERTSSEEGREITSPDRAHASIDGSVEPLDRIETPLRTQTGILRQPNTPSSEQQKYIVSSPRPSQHSTPVHSSVSPHLTDGQRSTTTVGQYSTSRPMEFGPEVKCDDPPRLHLHGYYNTQQGYTFKESMPQTEPRPKTQPAIRTRTLSSSSDPSHPPQRKRPDSMELSIDDVFGNHPTRMPPFNHREPHLTAQMASQHTVSNPNSNRSVAPHVRQDITQSESSSSSSLPYSLYELPDAQYDGAGASHQTGRGAYHSIRLRGNGVLSQPQPQMELPVPTRVPTSPSPLPSYPYSRGPSGQYIFRPSIGLLTSDDVLGAEQDAITAVQRNLSSPLDLIQDRAASHIRRISGQNHSHLASGDDMGGRSEHHPQRPGYASRQRIMPGNESFRWQPGSNARNWPNAGGHQAAHHPMQHARYSLPQPPRPVEGHAWPTDGMRGPRSQPRPTFRHREDPGVRYARPSLRHVTPTRRFPGVPPAYPFPRSLSRGPPSTSTTLDIASGTTSWRPPSVSGAVRRMPAQQQDQENSGEAQRELAAMREEFAAVGVRYGEDNGRRDRMDETPPRIGRIERRMAE